MTGLRDMTVHRRLCHATIAPDLDQFFHEEVATTGKQSLKRWLDKYKADNGATMYWRWTRLASKLDPPGNRDEFAHATLADAAKVCFVMHLLYIGSLSSVVQFFLRDMTRRSVHELNFSHPVSLPEGTLTLIPFCTFHGCYCEYL